MSIVVGLGVYSGGVGCNETSRNAIFKFTSFYSFVNLVIVFVVQCTMYIVRCTVYVVPCTLYTVQCTVYDV